MFFPLYWVGLPSKVLLPDGLLHIWLSPCFLLGKMRFVCGLAHRSETWSILTAVSRGRKLLRKKVVCCDPGLGRHSLRGFLQLSNTGFRLLGFSLSCDTGTLGLAVLPGGAAALSSAPCTHYAGPGTPKAERLRDLGACTSLEMADVTAEPSLSPLRGCGCWGRP